MKSNHLRFSLASLMLVVCVVAYACAAIRFASPFWASLTFTFSLALLSFAILGVILRCGEKRVFWIGFAVFGWGYLILVFGPWFSANVKDHLLTTQLLGYLHYEGILRLPSGSGRGVVFEDVDNDGWADLYIANTSQPAVLYKNVGNGKFLDVSRPSGVGTAVGDVDGNWNLDIFVTNINARVAMGSGAGPSWENFERVGHSLFGLVTALLGGMLAVWLARSREPQAASADHDSSK